MPLALGYPLGLSFPSVALYFPGGPVVKNLPAFQSPGQEDPLEGEKATHSSILA